MKQFEHHFKILDSIAKTTSSDVLLNCPESVKFMEKNTGIEATTDGNYFGRFSCKKSDLQKWHECMIKSIRKNNQSCQKFKRQLNKYYEKITHNSLLCFFPL
jgi:hypothetical protein